MSTMAYVVSLVDCNNLYVSCKRIFRKGYRYHKAGVMLSGLLPRGKVQADLWEKEGVGPERRRKLMQAHPGQCLDGLGDCGLCGGGDSQGLEDAIRAPV